MGAEWIILCRIAVVHAGITAVACKLRWRVGANRLSIDTFGDATEASVGGLKQLPKDLRLDVAERSFFVD